MGDMTVRVNLPSTALLLLGLLLEGRTDHCAASGHRVRRQLIE